MGLLEQLAAALGDRYRLEREPSEAGRRRGSSRRTSTVLAYRRIDPRLAPLRTHPRFVALARRIGGA